MAGPDAQRFDIAGTVVSADEARGTIVLDHEEIQGFMKAMRMELPVKEPWAAGAAEPGSVLTGTLVVDGARTWIEGVVLAGPGASPLRR